MKINPVKWTQYQPPNEEIRYNHVIGNTPFGRILITWKEWKEFDMPTIDEVPWSECGYFDEQPYTVEDAKTIAEHEFKKRVSDCISLERGNVSGI